MKHSALLVSAVVLAFAAATPARADDSTHPWNDEVGQWFVSPFVGMSFLDDDRLLDDGLHYGASIGKHLSDKWSAQLTGYTGDFDNDGKKPEWTWPASFDGSISGVSFDVLRVFARDSRISPYLLGGFGYQSSDYEGAERDDNVTASLGLGLMWDLARSADGSRTVQLRPEVRTRWDLQSGDPLNDIVAQVGIAFGWGAPRPAPVAAAPVVAPPPPPPPPAPEKCGDADGDGVCDEVDKCPNTSAGAKVDKVGCPLEQTLKLLFDFDSAELRPESITELERLVTFMGDVPFATALVEGHTDSIGTEAYNQGLSDRRAKAVFDYLTARGVDPARLKSIGHGELKPIADNATAEGRQMNRRVMLIRTDSGM
jgi:OmpA-OmpF porin, OOP family